MQVKFSEALGKYREECRLEKESIPVFGVGHSNGALLHLLINSGYGSGIHV